MKGAGPGGGLSERQARETGAALNHQAQSQRPPLLKRNMWS